MKKTYKILIAFVFGIIMISCGGDSGGDTTPDNGGDDNGGVVVEEKEPSASELNFPVNNEMCNIGKEIAGDASMWEVEFKWKPSENTRSYKLTIKDLTNTSAPDIVNSNIKGSSGEDFVTYSVNIKKNNQYQWKVESKNITKTIESAVWSMYSAGGGVSNYAPFPAKLNSPDNESTVGSTSPTVEWEGSDVDNDIASFDILVDTVNPPVAVKATAIKDDTSKQITGLASGTKYYWQVVTTDDFGNKTKSEVQEFTTP